MTLQLCKSLLTIYVFFVYTPYKINGKNYTPDKTVTTCPVHI